MTIKGFGPELAAILDGRPLTDYEREMLEIVQEECAEVIVAASKMLRFGTFQTNPATGVKNNVEFSEEIGNLLAMIDRVQVLPFYDAVAVRRGYKAKVEKLPTYTQFAP
jgi:hypothetical protein